MYFGYAVTFWHAYFLSKARKGSEAPKLGKRISLATVIALLLLVMGGAALYVNQAAIRQPGAGVCEEEDSCCGEDFVFHC